MSDIETDIKYIRRDLDSIIDKLDQNYVTKAEFAPVRVIVYGAVGLMLTGIFGALIGLVLIE